MASSTRSSLGNLEAMRDWGFAGDYVEGMWLMVQAPVADDYVLATGETNSVRRFIDVAAPLFGFSLEWQGKGEAETGIDRKSGRVLVRIDPRHFRPGRSQRARSAVRNEARQQLGWERRVKFDELVTLMAEADDRRVRDGAILLYGQARCELESARDRTHRDRPSAFRRGHER